VRVSDLLRCRVIDVDGAVVGRVSDVRVVQDGPIMRGLQAAMRVDALVVGRGGLAERLGFIRNRVEGPWPLRVLFERLERRARVVAIGDVASVDESARTIVLRSRSDAHGRVGAQG
jgi:hypothetical protein